VTQHEAPLKIGLIGLGAVAEAHLAGAAHAVGAEVVAAAEINAERLAEMTERWNIKGYSNAGEMLDNEDLDIACVLTPARSHREVTLQVAERGVHVLCEKPMAVTLEDCHAMMAACERHRVKFAYGSSYRFLPAVRKAKEITDGGELGKILFLTEHYIGGAGPENWVDYGPSHYPIGGPGGGAMGLVDHGVHLIDVFRWLTASEVKAAVGRGNISGDAPQTEFLTMIFASGAVGQLFYNEVTYPSDTPNEGIFSWGGRWGADGRVLPGGAWDNHPLSIRVHGTNGALRIFPYANQLFQFGQREIRQIPLEGRPMPGNFTRQLESFAACVRSDSEPEVTGEDGVRALEVILGAYQSTEEMRFVVPTEAHQ
jgi:predicted dehydrogenase